MATSPTKNLQYYKFSLYGFFKNLKFFDAFLLLYLLDNRLRFVEIGLLYSIREISMVILEIPSGVIADTWGRRKTLLISFLYYILSFIVFFLADSFVLFGLAMFLFALGDSFRTGVHKAMIYQYLSLHGWQDQKVTYYGHTRSWSQLGTAISSLAAGFIVFYTGKYDMIFIYSTIPYLLDMLLVWSYPSYLDGNIPKSNDRRTGQKIKEVFTAFFSAFKRLKFLKALGSSSIYTGYYRAVKDYMQPLLKYFALSIPVLAYMENEQKIAVIVGTVYFITYLMTAIASRYSGKFAAMFTSISSPINITIIVGFAFGIISGYAFSYGWFILSIATFITVLIIENLRKPIGTAVIADLSKDKALATILSATSQAKSIIAALLAPLIGILADILNPGQAIAIISLLLILGAPLYWLPKNTSAG